METLTSRNWETQLSLLHCIVYYFFNLNGSSLEWNKAKKEIETKKVLHFKQLLQLAVIFAITSFLSNILTTNNLVMYKVWEILQISGKYAFIAE